MALFKSAIFDTPQSDRLVSAKNDDFWPPKKVATGRIYPKIAIFGLTRYNLREAQSTVAISRPKKSQKCEKRPKRAKIGSFKAFWPSKRAQMGLSEALF